MINTSIQNYIQEQKQDNSVLVVYGPTASGKTGVSIAMAQALDGEVISADSRIFYKDMVIGTAAPTIEEMDGVIHHCVGHIDSEREYSVKDFQRDAYECIQDILKRGKLPIIVGGTNMYIDAVIDGYSVADFEVDEEIHAKIQELSCARKFQILQKLDPETASQVDPQNDRHFVRKLEYCLVTGNKYSDAIKKTTPEFFTPIKIALRWDKELLHDRIEKRVDIMFDQGLVDETKQLLTRYKKNHIAMSSIGYKQVIEYLDGEFSEEQMKENIIIATKQYAKRQMTWLRKKNDLEWFDC